MTAIIYSFAAFRFTPDDVRTLYNAAENYIGREIWADVQRKTHPDADEFFIIMAGQRYPTYCIERATDGKYRLWYQTRMGWVEWFCEDTVARSLKRLSTTRRHRWEGAA